MTEGALLRLWREEVLPDWVDYNGHLNEAYYLLIFSHATDAFMDHIGMTPGPEHRKETSLYTLETHLCYLEECSAGQEVEIATQLLDLDKKRFHIFHAMTLAGREELLATAEMVSLHVEMSGPRAAAFPPETLARLEAIHSRHKALPRPTQVNGVMGLKKK
jgi:acyl-CoA thioester hydrolase